MNLTLKTFFCLVGLYLLAHIFVFIHRKGQDFTGQTIQTINNRMGKDENR